MRTREFYKMLAVATVMGVLCLFWIGYLGNSNHRIHNLFIEEVEALADTENCTLPGNAECTGDKSRYCVYKTNGQEIRCKGSTLIFK